MMTAAVGLGLLMVGGALAQVISRSVIGPISKLARLAAESGDDPRPVATGLRETDEVAAILLTEARERAAAQADQARYADALRQSNKDLADEIAIRQGAEAALLAAKEAAEQANQTKSRFLAGITHELRTPLHGILGYAELLSLEGGLNQTQIGSRGGHDRRRRTFAWHDQLGARCGADRGRADSNCVRLKSNWRIWRGPVSKWSAQRRWPKGWRWF